MGLATTVVLQLTVNLDNPNHHICIDNFFYQQLLERGTYGCGNARSNRKEFPEELKYAK